MENRVLITGNERAASGIIHIFRQYASDTVIRANIPPAFCSHEPWQRQGKRKGRKKK